MESNQNNEAGYMEKSSGVDEKGGESLSEAAHGKDELDEREYQIGKEENTDLDIDWKNRVLCDDGNCIGVVGPDGYCKECGKRYEGPESIQAEQPETHCVETSPSETDEENSHEDNISAEKTAEYQPDEEPENDAEEIDPDLEWERRKLCSEGSCIGVIGPDGFCNECGKPYEKEAGEKRGDKSL